MSVQLSTIEGMLKEVYTGKEIQNIQNMTADTFPKLKKSDKKPTGTGFVFSANVKGNQRGQGSQNELEALRTPGNQTPLKSTVDPKIFTHIIQLSGLSMEVAKTNEDAFADNVTFQTESGLEDATKELNAQCYRDGSGKLAQVNGAVSGSATVTFDNGVPTHFRVGTFVDIINAGSVKQVDSIEIVGVDIGAKTITLASTQTCDDNSWIYREDVADSAPTEGKELAGFPLLTDDGTKLTVFQGISRSTYNQWDGISINALGANVSDDLLQRAAARVKVESGRQVKRLCMNPAGQFRKYLSVLTPAKEFSDGKKMDSGFEAVPTWNGLPIHLDTDCSFTEVYMYDPAFVERSDVYDLKLDDSTGNVVKWHSGYDAFVIYAKHYGNVLTMHPKSLVRVYNLAEPIY